MAKEEANKKAKAKAKTMHIKFLLSPTGAFDMGYNVGDEIKDFDAKKGKELIDAEYAIEVR